MSRLGPFFLYFSFFSYFSLDKCSYSLASPKDQSRDPETSLCNNCTVGAHGHLTHGRRYNIVEHDAILHHHYISAYS